jgi:hypothetical protein
MTHPNSIDENHIETIPDGPKTEEISETVEKPLIWLF